MAKGRPWTIVGVGLFGQPGGLQRVRQLGVTIEPTALTGPIVLAVLFGALLHAGWNALIQSGRDKQLDTALIHSIGLFVALPAVLWLGLPDPAAWPAILASTAIHLGYYLALAGGYRHGDLGLTSPVMRGSAPPAPWSWSRG